MEINIGDKFGDWTVLALSDKTDSSHNKYYTCQCVCGTIRAINRGKLISGKSKSCGCKRKVNMTGKIVKDLLFLEPSGYKNGKVIWKCKCLKCGRICNRTISKAKEVGTCGNHRDGKTLNENRKKRTQVDGTIVQTLTQKVSKNNTSGIKGVSFDKTRKLWVAQIGFQGKNYSLGKFKKIEDAEKARKDAEDRFFKPIIDKYKKD